MDPRSLPLLIQQQVLFPGAMLPVRIWAARQRKLIKDAVAGDRIVGVVSMSGMLSGDEQLVRAGQVGCLARIISARRIPNRQIRVVLEGVERFVTQQILVTDEPYQTAQCAPYSDFEESPALLETFAEEVRQYYARYLKASGKIADATREKASQLPTDPAELSMALPAMLRLDEETAQRFLASRSTLMRLRELSALLAPAASTAEASAEVHARSRSNGHGARLP
jgi:Lon protease-like protein